MKVVVVSAIARSLLLFRGDLLREMVAAGHEVLALAPEESEEVRRGLEAIGVAVGTIPLHRTSLNPIRDAQSVVALARVYRGYRPDALLVYNPKPVIYGLLAARLAGVPMRAAMITGVGSALGSGAGLHRRLLARVTRTLYAVALRGAHVVFFQNPDDERFFRRGGLLGRGARVARINGSGVDLAFFAPTPLPDTPVTFLTICRLLRDKGLVEYVEAARIVRAAHREVRVQILGPLDTNPSAIAAAELDAWIREGAVEYLGSTPDVRPFLAAAHVYVLPSYGEGMPRSTLEAMAMGRPIVTTDVPGCRETVEEGRNGHLVPVRDAASLADGMLRMIGEPERLEAMGSESRRIAEERFDVHAVNQVILAAMGLADGGKAPGR